MGNKVGQGSLKKGSRVSDGRKYEAIENQSCSPSDEQTRQDGQDNMQGTFLRKRRGYSTEEESTCESFLSPSSDTADELSAKGKDFKPNQNEEIKSKTNQKLLAVRKEFMFRVDNSDSYSSSYKIDQSSRDSKSSNGEETESDQSKKALAGSRELLPIKTHHFDRRSDNSSSSASNECLEVVKRKTKLTPRRSAAECESKMDEFDSRSSSSGSRIDQISRDSKSSNGLDIESNPSKIALAGSRELVTLKRDHFDSCSGHSSSSASIDGVDKSIKAALTPRKLADGYECPLCPEIFKVKIGLKSHVRVVHTSPDEPSTSPSIFKTVLICENCSQKTRKEENFRGMKSRSDWNLPYRCSFCSTKHKSKRQRRTHVGNYHTL